MEAQLGFNVVVAIVMPVLLFMLRTTWGRITTLENQLTEHRVDVAESYAKKTLVESLEAKILHRLDQIWEKIDEKADKS